MAIEGPLAPWASGMAERLTELGYCPRVVERHLQLAGGLSKYLNRHGLVVGDIGPEVIERFIASPRVSNRSWPPTARSLSWLIDYLVEVGVASPPVAAVERGGQRELIERYRDHLMMERGLEPATIAKYAWVATQFLTAQNGRALGVLSAAEVSGFVSGRGRELLGGRHAGAALVTGLRAFLRFARAEGLITRALDGAVPSVARWSGAGLPRGLSSTQVVALLASCDRRRALGRRDYAILVLLVRLGLRAAEVSALRLEDINWRAGEVLVRGKGRTEDRLPLPADVGAAMTAYLRSGRPAGPSGRCSCGDARRCGR
jgi:hypothetical protein